MYRAATVCDYLRVVSYYLPDGRLLWRAAFDSRNNTQPPKLPYSYTGPGELRVEVTEYE